MTASPAPDARVVAVTANSPGCLIICLASLTAIVGTFAWTVAAVRHPKLASKWYDVRPPEDLPDRCYRFHLVVPGAHDLLARAVRDRHPGLWIGEFEHTAAPALASRSEQRERTDRSRAHARSAQEPKGPIQSRMT
ncbi:hypothetical protein [Streptosporangium sp. NPDC000396]|uniref:hypothetical protein n=1 Tax=Streptosporangium sp. NPDC000396 TaxID=3366185 RepID=UPI003699F89C